VWSYVVARGIFGVASCWPWGGARKYLSSTRDRYFADSSPCVRRPLTVRAVRGLSGTALICGYVDRCVALRAAVVDLWEIVFERGCPLILGTAFPPPDGLGQVGVADLDPGRGQRCSGDLSPGNGRHAEAVKVG
jgi:hypothetical protein